MKLEKYYGFNNKSHKEWICNFEGQGLKISYPKDGYF